MTTMELVLLSFVAVLIGVLILVAVLFLRTLHRMAEFADSIHTRSQHFQDNLLDRLMAVDYASYKTWRASEEAESGGWEPPDFPPEMPGPDEEGVISPQTGRVFREEG